MIKCICIDSKNKPKEIPLGKWISEGMWYYITHIYYHPGQGVQGVTLNEVRLGEESSPYKSFRLSRFGFTEKGLSQLREMLEAISEMESQEVDDLIKELIDGSPVERVHTRTT